MNKPIEVWRIDNADYVGAKDAARYLGVSVNKIYHLALLSEIKYYISKSGRVMIEWLSLKSYAIKQPQKTGELIPVVDSSLELEPTGTG